MKLFTLLSVLMIYGTALNAAPSLQLPMKLDYAEGVIMRSKSAERIEKSDNDEAKSILLKARNKYKQARQAQSDGEFAQSEKLANEAPVKMLFPLVFFIFPSVFLVLLGPVVMDLLRSGVF